MQYQLHHQSHEGHTHNTCSQLISTTVKVCLIDVIPYWFISNANALIVIDTAEFTVHHTLYSVAYMMDGYSSKLIDMRNLNTV